MDYDINYLGFKGEVVETLNYNNKYEFENEIRVCFECGIPIDFKYLENQEEIER